MKKYAIPALLLAALTLTGCDGFRSFHSHGREPLVEGPYETIPMEPAATTAPDPSGGTPDVEETTPQMETSEESRFVTHYNAEDGWAVLDGIWADFGALPENLVCPYAIDGVPVKEIGELAFADETELQRVVLPPELVRIGAEAFAHSTLQGLSLSNYPSLQIGDYAFADCRDLGEVSIVASDVTTDSYAFAGSGATALNVENAGLTLGKYSFFEADYLETIRTTGVFDAGQYSFSHCARLQTVELGGRRIQLRNYSFYDTAVSELRITAQSGSIDDYVFCECSALQSLVITEGLNRIGDYSFTGCPEVKELWLPASLHYIGENSFLDVECVVHAPKGSYAAAEMAERGFEVIEEFSVD